MPWNRFYYPAGSLSKEAKDDIAKGITEIYGKSYPAHSTLVAFIEIPEGDFYRGGKPADTLIRITLQNMMGSFSTIQKDNEFLPAVKAVWKPWIDDKGLSYELQMEQIQPEEVSFDEYKWPSSVLSMDVFQTMIKENRFIQPAITVPEA